MTKYVLLFLLSLPTFATEINFHHKLKDTLKAIVTHAEPHDFGTFKISNRYNKEYIVLCAGNSFHNNKNSYIEYENFFGIHSANFIFTDNLSCHSFLEYLNGVFPGINENNPIEISFDRKSRTIKSISLPNLDLLEDGEESDKLILSTL